MKNATIKRLLGVIMALVLLAGMLAGCGDSGKETQGETSGKDPEKTTEVGGEATTEAPDELEPVTLKIHLPGTEGEGTKDVIEAFNAKLAELLPNTTVEVEFYGTYKEYGEQWTMLLAGKEQIDIAWAGWTTPYLNDIKDGSILPLTDLINESTPNLLAEQETYEMHFTSCTYEGEIYGVPCIQPSFNESQGFYYNPIIEPYFDVDAMIAELRNNSKMTEKVLDLIEEAVQKAIDDGALKVGDMSWNIPVTSLQLGLKGYIGATNNMYFDPEAGESPENLTIMYEWELPEMQMCYERFAKWYDWGWITDSQVVGQLPQGSVQLFRFVKDWNQNWSNADENGIIKDVKNNTDGTMNVEILTNTPDNYYRGMTTFAGYSSYLVMPYYAENPERAMMLIDLLRGEVGTPGNDLMNLLCYGFEANSDEAKKYGWSNYTAVEEDGQLKVDTSILNGAESKHKVTNWVVGNTYKTMHDGSALTTATSRAYGLKYWNEIFPNTKTTVATGMCYDSAGMADDIADMKNVYTQYNDLLKNGAGGTEKLEGLLKEALDELYDCNFEAVKKDVVDQIVAFNNAK